MEKLLNGFKSTVRKKRVNPYLYTDGKLMVSNHYRGYVTCLENGKRLWTKSTGIDRISRGSAQKDAYRLIHDLIYEQFYSNNPDIEKGF